VIDCGSVEVGRLPPMCSHGLEVFALSTVPHIELVSNDWKPHWVCAEQQVAIFDGCVAREVRREYVSAASVPARTMLELGRSGRRSAARAQLRTIS
jgi:hypothetical protein